jgi:tryptophan halogenase
MQARLLAESLFEANRQLLPLHRDLYNQRIARNVDSIRWFLSVHYKFNTLLNTPFWQHCRAATDVSGAQPVIDYYKQVGPSTFWEFSLLDMYDFATMTGYLQLLVGQRVPHAIDARLTPEQQALFNQRVNQNRQAAQSGFTVKQALEMLNHPAAVFH